jgi:hypothetical protein
MTETQNTVAQYTWSGGLPPVGAGAFQSDSRNWSGASELNFSNADMTAEDLSATFAALAVDDTIRAEQAGNPSNWRVWTVTQAATEEADLSWTVPVASLSSHGNNVSNNQPCHVVFTLAATPSGTLADWTIAEDGAMPGHWWSEVVCPHGTTRAGVWTQGQIVDDRNFVAEAEPAFFNHQQLLPDCDCVLNIAWTPSYTPPAPLEAQPQAVGGETPDQQASTGTATWMYVLVQPPSEYLGYVACPHGTTLTDIWQGWPPPPMPFLLAMQQEALLNHQRVLYGCACTYAAPGPPTATMTFPQQTSIPRDASVALTQSPSGSVPTGFLVDSFGRLSATQAGVASISATFFLARSVAQGGSGFASLRLPDAGTPNLTAPSAQTVAMIDVNGQSTATLQWTGQIAANTSFEVNYWNGSAFVEDIQGGSLTVTLQ